MKQSIPLALFVTAAMGLAACDETLEGGLGCGVLCPETPSAVVQDTLYAVAVDSSLTGFPSIGSEGQLLLSTRGDTLDARAVIRFDSLPATFRHRNSVTDSNIVDVDSATLRLIVAGVDTLGPPFTVELYDVDVATGDDTAAATLVPLFEPSRFLGSRTFDPMDARDTIFVPIDSQRLRQRIQTAAPAPRRLRIGVRITSAGSADFSVFSSNTLGPPELRLRVSLDTNVFPVTLPPLSKTPSDQGLVAAELADFQIVADGPAPPPAAVLRVGGVPGARVYMRFDLPARIIDSSSIVRVQLQLTQRPAPDAPAAADTGGVQPFAVSSGGVLTDIQRALAFLVQGLDTIPMVPADSGLRTFEVIDLVRGWRATKPERTPRALALRATEEGVTPFLADFFSNEAPQDVRPRLVITYVPHPKPSVP